MYNKLPNLVLGFHGCSKETFSNVIYDGQQLKDSLNEYDWLGNGKYFWEQNFKRAFDWAEKRYNKDAAVIGAVIDLGYCLNLMDSKSMEFIKLGYKLLSMRCKIAGSNMPENRKSTKTTDILLRDLDCAVIQQVHRWAQDTENMNDFDSVRGVFVEGDPPYPGAEMREKTHIQICVCNPNCIKGYFNPMAPTENYCIP